MEPPPEKRTQTSFSNSSGVGACTATDSVISVFADATPSDSMKREKHSAHTSQNLSIGDEAADGLIGMLRTASNQDELFP
jgi:hypothetical protein